MIEHYTDEKDHDYITLKAEDNGIRIKIGNYSFNVSIIITEEEAKNLKKGLISTIDRYRINAKEKRKTMKNIEERK